MLHFETQTKNANKLLRAIVRSKDWKIISANLAKQYFAWFYFRDLKLEANKEERH